MPPRRYKSRNVKRRRPYRRRTIRRPRRMRMTKTVKLNVKRYTCGRLMTLYGTTASAGATFTFNAANNLMSLTTSATNTTHYFALAMAFCIADIPAVSDFTTLFDQFKLNCVVLRFFPVATEVSTGTSAGGNTSVGGWVHHIIDSDDYATPTASDVGVDDLRQYSGYKVQNLVGRRPISRKIYPKISMAAAGTGGAFNSAVNVPRKWINLAYTDTIHYGFKAVFEIYDPVGVASNLSYKVEPIYYLSFRNIR